MNGKELRYLSEGDEKGRRVFFSDCIWYERKEGRPKSPLLFGRTEKWKERK